MGGISSSAVDGQFVPEREREREREVQQYKILHLRYFMLCKKHLETVAGQIYTHRVYRVALEL